VADAEWSEIQNLVAATQAKTADLDPYTNLVDSARRRDRLHDLLLQFIRSHPADARCPEAIFQLLMRPPAFLLEVDKARFAREGERAARYDTEAVARWTREAEALQARFLSDPKLNADWRRDLLRRDIYIEARDLSARFKSGEAVDPAPLRGRLERWLADYGSSDRVAVPVESYMRLLALVQPDAVEEAWTRFARSPNPILRELAEGQLLVVRSQTYPLSWKFTALDGREVDFQKLRGKVLLIDFWATWCAPCVAELPELKKLYSEYRDKGFELVGVSLDAEGDREKLETFIRVHEIAWPQFFDGGGRRNAYAVRYGIKSVPTKILVDGTGKIVQPRVQLDELPKLLPELLAR
jgi:thiol-disulfide isomerase/thioredoxin